MSKCSPLLREAQQKEQDATLEALLLEGLASGDAGFGTAQFRRELKDEAVGISVFGSGPAERDQLNANEGFEDRLIDLALQRLASFTASPASDYVGWIGKPDMREFA